MAVRARASEGFLIDGWRDDTPSQGADFLAMSMDGRNLNVTERITLV